MFNKDVPYNNLPFLPAEINYDSVRILKALGGAKGAIGRLDAFTNFLPDKEMFLTHFAIKESVESSQIENINTSVETAYEASIQKEEYLNKDQKEVLYYKEALLVGTKIIKEQGGITQKDYLKIGALLAGGNGKLRTGGLVNIKKNESEVLYTPPAGIENIQRLLGNLENYFNNMIEHDIDTLIKMALIHYQFEAIHPFYDGNGRTGRILMVLNLLLNKNLEFPIIFLSGYINKNRSTYYKLLKNVTEKGEWENFIVFMLNAIEVQSLETISSIKKIMSLREKFVKTLENDGVIKPVFAEPLASLLISKPKLLREDLAPFGSKNTLTLYINRLIEIGLLKVSGKIGVNKIVYTNVKFIELTK